MCDGDYYFAKVHKYHSIDKPALIFLPFGNMFFHG